jgi:hypothetical protein
VQEKDIDAIIDFSKIGIVFQDKPLIVGGLAMEYHGARKHGDDVDFIVSNRDYKTLRLKYPHNRKDMWGDFGIKVNGFEMFRSIYRFDYDHYCQNCVEFTRYKIVSLDMLFRMKVFAMDADEKHRKDVDLLKQQYEKLSQNKTYKAYLDAHVDRYLAVPNGTILNGDYDDDQ